MTASNGDVYGVCPGNDFYGNDLPEPYAPQDVDSLDDCVEACSKAPGCIAAAYLDDQGVCWTKNKMSPANYNSDVDAIYKLSSAKKVS